MTMKGKSVVVFVTVLLALLAVTEGFRKRRPKNLKITDCMKNASDSAVTLKNYYLTPDPMELPGNMTLGGHIQVNRFIDGNVTGHVEISKWLGFFWLPVPCISNVGTCTYPDLCGMIVQKLSDNGTDVTNATTEAYTDGVAGEVRGGQGEGDNVTCPQALQYSTLPACSCPFPPGHYFIRKANLEVRHLSGLISWLATGDYRAKVWMTDEEDETIACLQLELSVVEGKKGTDSCTGFLCGLFG